jgi:hypothetical protein
MMECWLYYHVNASKDPELDGQKVVGVSRGRDEI